MEPFARCGVRVRVVRVRVRVCVCVCVCVCVRVDGCRWLAVYDGLTLTTTSPNQPVKARLAHTQRRRTYAAPPHPRHRCAAVGLAARK
jgi:hypothetical protein